VSGDGTDPRPERDDQPLIAAAGGIMGGAVFLKEREPITLPFRVDQAAAAYRLFDTQTTGKGVFVF
jgi:hypothetical protein